MKIHWQGADRNPNVDRETTAYGNAVTETPKSGGIYKVDISGTVMDNNAYTGHGKTAEDVMQEAGSQDLTWQRNYMTVMSHSMSDEDFAKLQEEGFHPGSTEIETVVTIVDRIKAELAKSGETIVGYTDTLDRDTLVELTGDPGLAEEILAQFHRCDVPVTEENGRAVLAALAEGRQLEQPQDGAARYLIENRMEPTIENLYLAAHSGAGDASRQARGYYDMGAGGYLARKADSFDWQNLMPQMRHILEEAGFSADDQAAMDDARWLLETGIELTPENLLRLEQIRTLPLPASDAQLVEAAAAALGSGKSPKAAVPGIGETLTEQSVRLYEETARISDEAADQAAAQGQPLTLRRLREAQRALEEEGTARTALQNVQARRLLEEARLHMSLEANRLLLKKGFAIDTAPMEKLIEALKQAEAEYRDSLFDGTDAAKAEEKAASYQRTLDAASYLRGAPAAVIGSVAFDYETRTLTEIEREARKMQAAYEKAGESYETLMTVPRSDLGDSIQKAFENTDDLLRELRMEESQDNRRAVRILGYNRMEITAENIEIVKSADTSLRQLLKKMTPSAVLQMIRDGENPLELSMTELSDYLNGQEEDRQQDTEKYSRFLYRLEKNDRITEEEKTSYIGIYRMLHTLEKNDGAALGALIRQGAEVTFQNLLTAVRSRKKSGMDYTVDDAFAGVERSGNGTETISGQIRAAYTYAKNLIHEMYQDVSPQLLEQAALREDMTLPQAAEALREAAAAEDPQAEADWEWTRQQAQEIREAAGVQEDVVETLLDLNQPVTADNLTAAWAYLQNWSGAWNDIRERAAQSGREEALQKAEENLTDRFTSQEAAQEAYAELAQEAGAVLRQEEETAQRYVEVKALSLLHRQLTLFTGMSREESYEIPADIGGERTSIRLHIRRGTSSDKKGSVVITCKTERLGNVAGEFSLRYDDSGGQAAGVSGYMTCEQDEGGCLTGIRQRMEALLEQEGLTENRIRVFDRSPVELSRFGASSRTAEKGGQTTETRADTGKMLYRTAKLFLTALKTENA